MNNPFEAINQRLVGIENLLAEIHSKTTKEEERFHDVKETAKILRVSEQSIHTYIRKGMLKAKKVGRPYLIAHSELFDELGNVKSLKYQR